MEPSALAMATGQDPANPVTTGSGSMEHLFGKPESEDEAPVSRMPPLPVSQAPGNKAKRYRHSSRIEQGPRWADTRTGKALVKKNTRQRACANKAEVRHKPRTLYFCAECQEYFCAACLEKHACFRSDCACLLGAPEPRLPRASVSKASVP